MPPPIARPAPDLAGCRCQASRDWALHWWSLPSDGPVPLRSALDPVRLGPALLPRLVIYDLAEPGVARIRLMGTETAANFGFDPTGRDYLDFVEPERREEALQGFLVPARHPCGMRVVGESRYNTGLATLVETVAFPFRRDDGAGLQMIFVTSQIQRWHLSRWESARLMTFHPVERHFIDIGAGIP